MSHPRLSELHRAPLQEGDERDDGHEDNRLGGRVAELRVGAIGNHATAVQIDLSDLHYMDSSGLRILVTLASRLDVLQIKLDIIAPPNSPTRRVLELAGFGSL